MSGCSGKRVRAQIGRSLLAEIEPWFPDDSKMEISVGLPNSLGKSKEALELHVEMTFSTHAGEPYKGVDIWSVNLRDAILESLEIIAQDGLDERQLKALTTFAAGLRALADTVEKRADSASSEGS